MAKQDTLEVAVRTKFGKGPSRRDRQAGLVPAVLYGHGSDPRHLNLPAHELSAILRSQGVNAVITLKIAGENQLALTKQIVVHPIRNYIEHVDLLVVRRGEKVTVEVPVVLEGDAVAGSSVAQDANTLEILAEPLHIPEQITVNIEDAEIGTQILAGQLTLPAGIELVSSPETLVVNITEIAEADLGDDEAAAGADTAEATAEETKE